MRVGVRGGGECLGVHVILRFTLSKPHDERGHRHFDLEFDHIDERVELDVYDLVFKEH